ncbi:uncharacterized protein LOC130804113, partial [Amaranthus tricolor]|uniref:uncharacterized protein LOC130804113 n=1 Tax=Amaranthus tricolor TaxID=29722 RepID=UPI002582774E
IQLWESSTIQHHHHHQFLLGFSTSLYAGIFYLDRSHVARVTLLICVTRRVSNPSRGCLGCCTMPQLIIAVDEPSKGLKIQGRKVKKPNISEDNWSRSKHEMDISAVQLQRSISSMSTSNQNLDPHGSSGSRSNPEFVNNGLLLWTQRRQQWVGDRKFLNQPIMREPKIRSCFAWLQITSKLDPNRKMSSKVQAAENMLPLLMPDFGAATHDQLIMKLLNALFIEHIVNYLWFQSCLCFSFSTLSFSCCSSYEIDKFFMLCSCDTT